MRQRKYEYVYTQKATDIYVYVFNFRAYIEAVSGRLNTVTDFR